MNHLSVRMLTIGFLVFSALFRLVPHPPSATAVAAVAIFAGCYLSGLEGAILTLGVMAISDLIGYCFNLPGMGFYDKTTMLTVYASLSMSAFIGRGIRGRVNWLTVPAAALASAVLFFLVTNFASWRDPLMAYPQTAEGLLSCYAAGLAFVGEHNLALNMLVANLFFTGVFFLIYRGLVARQASHQRLSA
jgi:hypothetical protein